MVVAQDHDGRSALPLLLDALHVGFQGENRGATHLVDAMPP